MRAEWRGTVLAESDDTIVVEGNHYFPRESLADGFFSASKRTSYCPWKGSATYLDIEVDGDVNPAAAWYYAAPKSAAAEIRDRVAFWNGVSVTD